MHNNRCAKLRWKQESTTQTTPWSCSNKPTEQRYECLDKPEAQEYPWSRSGDASYRCENAGDEANCNSIYGVNVKSPNGEYLSNAKWDIGSSYLILWESLTPYQIGYNNAIFWIWTNYLEHTPLELTRICEWTPVAQASCTILNENSCKSNSNCTRTPPKNNIQINYSCVDDQDRKYSDSACAGISK